MVPSMPNVGTRGSRFGSAPVPEAGVAFKGVGTWLFSGEFYVHFDGLIGQPQSGEKSFLRK